ncbi:MAG: hypothetical protein ABF391_17260 [Akkermansiaceae bacterium]
MKEVTPAEWLTLASGEYDVGTYTLIQKHLLILAIRSVPTMSFFFDFFLNSLAFVPNLLGTLLCLKIEIC